MGASESMLIVDDFLGDGPSQRCGIRLTHNLQDSQSIGMAASYPFSLGLSVRETVDDIHAAFGIYCDPRDLPPSRADLKLPALSLDRSRTR